MLPRLAEQAFFRSVQDTDVIARQLVVMPRTLALQNIVGLVRP